MATDKDREYFGGSRRTASLIFIGAGQPPETVNTRPGGDRDIRDKAGPASLAHGLTSLTVPGHKAFRVPGARYSSAPRA